MDSILLQKQVTETAEELQNLAADLINWEKDMKRKEETREQEKSKPQEELPPVRRKLRKKEDQEEVKMPEPLEMTGEQMNERQKREESFFEKERGNELVKVGKYAEAIHHYTRAIECYSKDPVFYTNRALCYLNMKQYREAETDCTIALQLDSNNIKAYLRRGLALKELHQLPEAHDDLQKALKLEPNNARVKAEAAKVEKLVNERTSKSVPSKENSKQTAYTYKEKGNAFVKKGNWLEAIENYTEACRLFPEDSSFYSNRALCYLKLNEPKKTILDCIRALELDHNNTKALYRKALANEMLGHDSAAHDDLLAAFQLEPNNKAIEDQLNKIEKKLGLKQENDTNKPSQNTQPSNKRISGERFLKLGGEFVEPIQKPPHLLSKKPLKKITISEKSEIDILQHALEEITPENEVPLKELNGAKPTESKTKHVPIKVEAPQIDVNTLPLPKTSMQFITAWNKLLTDPFLQYQYLKRLSGKNFPTIFKDALETDVFSQILEVLASEFIKAKEPVYDYLYGLSNVKRFSALILFASEEDKDNIKLAINHCNGLNEVSSAEMSSLKSRFYY